MGQSHDSVQEVLLHRVPSAGMILYDPQDLINLPSANDNSRIAIFHSNQLRTKYYLHNINLLSTSVRVTILNQREG